MSAALRRRASRTISPVQVKIKAGRNNYRPYDYNLDDDICFHGLIIPEADGFPKRKKSDDSAAHWILQSVTMRLLC